MRKIEKSLRNEKKTYYSTGTYRDDVTFILAEVKEKVSA